MRGYVNKIEIFKSKTETPQNTLKQLGWVGLTEKKGLPTLLETEIWQARNWISYPDWNRISKLITKFNDISILCKNVTLQRPSKVVTYLLTLEMAGGGEGGRGELRGDPGEFLEADTYK